MTITSKQIALTALLLTVVSAALSTVVVYRRSIFDAISSTRQFSFAIASSPSSAEVILDGKPIGRTPLTIPIEPGQHVAELHKDGFESTSRAFYATVISSKLRESVQELNIELKKLDIGPAKTATASAVATQSYLSMPTTQKVDPAVAKELRALRSMILANPEESVTVTAIQERMRLQAEEIKGLRDDLKEVKEQSKWLIGIIVTVVLGLLAAVVAVLQAFPKNGSKA